VDFADLSDALSSAGALGDVPPELISEVEYVLWVGEMNGVLLPVGTQLIAILELDDGEGRVDSVTTLGGVNEPVDIRAPEGVVATTFPLELPMPDDATVIIEDAETLGFLTAESPEEMLAFYTEALTADGWTAGESREEMVDDLSVEFLPFTREEASLELAVAVVDGETLVSFYVGPLQ
jgi:hypothetical protein